MFTLFVFATKDGWVSLMYDGIDAVGIDKQVSIYTFVNLLLLVIFLNSSQEIAISGNLLG